MSDTLLSALTFDMLSSLILIVLYIRCFTLQNENTEPQRRAKDTSLMIS